MSPISLQFINSCLARRIELLRRRLGYFRVPCRLALLLDVLWHHLAKFEYRLITVTSLEAQAVSWRFLLQSRLGGLPHEA